MNKAEIPTSSQEINAFERKFRETKYLQYINTWHVNICQYPKLDFYRQIKRDFRIEPHILYVQNKNVQQALTRLRVSSHNLLIERGRHSRPICPRGERICKFCSLNEIDDVMHFVSNCTFHDSECISLIENVYLMIQLDYKSVSSIYLKAHVNSKNKNVLRALGCFVYTGFKKRDENSHIWIVFSCIY